MIRKTTLLSVLLLGLMLVGPPALGGTKEEIIRLQSDVLQLQNLIRELQKGLDQENGTSQTLLEQLNDQVARTNQVLEQMVGVLTAQKGELIQIVSGLQDDIEGVTVKLDDTNNRVAALHQKVEQVQVQTERTQMPSFSNAGGLAKPDQVYSLAFNDYLAGNYELAGAAFKDFLRNYSDSEYADNAAYYLGLCLYNQGRLEPAIQALDQVINIYPKGDLTPSAYFKKARFEQELQKIDEAIETYKKLLTLYPDSEEARIAADELQQMGIEVPVKKSSRRQ